LPHRHIHRFFHRFSTVASPFFHRFVTVVSPYYHRFPPSDHRSQTRISPFLKRSLGRSPPKKNPKKFFDYNLDFDITSNKQEVDITGKTDLVTPTWKIRQTFNEGNVNKSKFRKDFYLGDLETESDYIIIKCRDHEYVDGDRIRLMINGAVLHPNILLSSVFYVVDVDLDDGYNNIDFIALNEGESSPNTAQLIVMDEFGKQLSNKKWLISTGYKAKLVVFKK